MSTSTKEWQHGLCGCFGNCGICLITYCVPCYTAGKVAEKVGDSCIACGLVLCLPILGNIFGALVRRKVREQKQIEGSLLGDLVVWFCCPLCALAQEAQEVNAMGYQAMDRE